MEDGSTPPHPPLGEAMMEAGLEEVEMYITWRKNMVMQYIATMPILELCEEAEQRLGAQFSNRWWDQEGLNLAGSREVADMAGETEEADEVAVGGP